MDTTLFCANCGTSLDPVSLINSVYVTDVDGDTGMPVQLRYGRTCGCAAKLLPPSQTTAFTQQTGAQPPARAGNGPDSDG